MGRRFARNAFIGRSQVSVVGIALPGVGFTVCWHSSSLDGYTTAWEGESWRDVLTMAFAFDGTCTVEESLAKGWES